MMRRCVPAGLAALVLVLAEPAWAETLLHLGETATVMAAPDEIAATLRAEATSVSASEAQSRVNATMQDALAAARQITGIAVSTGGYSVWHIAPTLTDHAEHWQVSQSLNLTGHDGPALLTLVGALQQRGLAVGILGWRLSREARRTAHQAATDQALLALRTRTENAAAQLGMRFDQFKDIRLDSAGPPPMMPRATVGMAMTSAGSAPPAAVAEDVPVSATAEADVLLLPR
jgi:predicted secreted protein